MRAILGIALVLVSGCSFVTVRGVPSSDPGTRPVPCTESRLPPAVDTVPAVGLLGSGLVLIGTGLYLSIRDRDKQSDVISPGPLLLLMGLPAAGAGLPFGASAWYGYRKTGQCRQMNREPPPQQPFPPPGPGPMGPPAPADPPGAAAPPPSPWRLDG